MNKEELKTLTDKELDELGLYRWKEGEMKIGDIPTHLNMFSNIVKLAICTIPVEFTRCSETMKRVQDAISATYKETGISIIVIPNTVKLEASSTEQLAELGLCRVGDVPSSASDSDSWSLAEDIIQEEDKCRDVDENFLTGHA